MDTKYLKVYSRCVWWSLCQVSYFIKQIVFSQTYPQKFRVIHSGHTSVSLNLPNFGKICQKLSQNFRLETTRIANYVSEEIICLRHFFSCFAILPLSSWHKMTEAQNAVNDFEKKIALDSVWAMAQLWLCLKKLKLSSWSGSSPVL